MHEYDPTRARTGGKETDLAFRGPQILGAASNSECQYCVDSWRRDAGVNSVTEKGTT